jgi:hypothetical protein
MINSLMIKHYAGIAHPGTVIAQPGTASFGFGTNGTNLNQWLGLAPVFGTDVHAIQLHSHLFPFPQLDVCRHQVDNEA